MTIKEALNHVKPALQKKIDIALQTEIFAAVQAAERIAIKNTVYEAYTPNIYDRRYDNGGMMDVRNIQIENGTVQNGRLVVINETPPNPYWSDRDVHGSATVNKSLPELINYGHSRYVKYSGRFGYDFPKKKYAYYKARPFIEETRTILKNKGTLDRRLGNALKRQGLRIEK